MLGMSAKGTESQSVAVFIRMLEMTFQIAYGRDESIRDTRDKFLHCQLQQGRRYELMKSSAVSGAQIYQELCIAAKNEEKRLAELKKRHQYLMPSQQRKVSELPVSRESLATQQGQQHSNKIPW